MSLPSPNETPNHALQRLYATMHALTSSPAFRILVSVRPAQRAATCVGILTVLAATFGLLAQTPSVEIRLTAKAPGSRLLFTSVFPAGPQPLVITPLDVNGDGHTDLAIADYGNSMTILTNDGAGRCSTAQYRRIRSSPVQLAAGDLNGDGLTDLVSCNSSLSDNSVTVLTNSPAGTFFLHARVPVGLGPVSITSGDLNVDGNLDIVTADYGSSTLTVLTNDGHANLTISQTLLAGGFAHGVDAIDADKDGFPDLVVTSYNGSDLRVYTNDHAGQFSLSSSMAVPGQPRWQAAGDFNHDGYPDIATANAGDGTVAILLNNKDGTFRSSATLSTGIGAYGVSAGDIDGDGSLDLAVANYQRTNNTVAVFRNDGAGNFSLMQILGVADSPYNAKIVDLDHSGTGVLVMPSGTSNTVSLAKYAFMSATVSWPSTADAFFVEQCNSLTRPSWWMLPEAAIVRGPTNRLSFPLTGASSFFRLVR